ncbi:MAG: hypothetical protein OHK93_006457 [Ramalina farinacea]|uniref:Uncharacterized protein n=1 Tax=Ramalina farinacea TaxID=258253 RepID=A0AA43QKW2_9LECA|nr:hypothetical protein [Ramalina farinacea]
MSGRRNPPGKGGQASQSRGPSSSKENGPPLRGIIQNTSSAAGSRSSASARSGALASQPHSAKDQAQIRGEAKGRVGNATLTGDKRAASELESENRPRKRQAIGLPRKPTPMSIPRSVGARCIVGYDCKLEGFKPLFGSLNALPGVSIKVNTSSEPTGEISITLSMGVNKGNIFQPVSVHENEISRFKLVWRLNVKTANDTLYQVERLHYTSLDRNRSALGDAREIIKEELKGRLGGLKLLDVEVNGCQVESPYESQYWQRLRNGTGPQRKVHVGVAFLYSLAEARCPPIHFMFWFKPGYLGWDQICGSVLKRSIQMRNAANPKIPVQKAKASNRAPKDAPCSGEKGSADGQAPKDKAGRDKILEPSQAPENDGGSEEGELVDDEMSDEEASSDRVSEVTPAPEDDPCPAEEGTVDEEELEDQAGSDGYQEATSADEEGPWSETERAVGNEEPDFEPRENMWGPSATEAPEDGPVDDPWGAL